MGDKTLWIVLAAVAVYFLFMRRPAIGGYRPPAPVAYRPPQPQPSTGQQAIQAGATALGLFLGNIYRGSSSGSSSGSDDLMTPTWTTSGTAYADDSFDSDSYAFS